jgi:hypothetical protein
MAERPSILQSTATAAIRTDMLDNHVGSMSLPSLWEKSYLCPCRNRATRQPNQACKLCHGRGIAYLPAKPLNIIIQSQEKGVFNGDIGLLDTGTAIGTPDRGTQVAFRDRITLPTVTVSQSFIFDVSPKRLKHGFYMVYDVKSIDFATTIKGELTEGVDYEFDRENNLFIPKKQWEGENISINIQTTLRYMVADLLKEHRYARNQQGQLEKTPQKLLLKREDIFIDKEAFEIGVEKDHGEMIDTKRKPSVDGLNGFFRSGGANG